MDIESRVQALEAHCGIVEDAVRQLAAINEMQSRLIGYLLLHNPEAAGRLEILMEHQIMLAAPVSDAVVTAFDHFYQMVKPSLDARQALEEEEA